MQEFCSASTLCEEDPLSKRTPKIGPAVQKERKRKGLTLEQLALRSGVSKSMLSQIERGEANPTFAVVWSLTQALEIDVAELIGGTSSQRHTVQIEVTSGTLTPRIESADGLCQLKILGPPKLAGQTEWYEVEIQPGGKLDSDPHTLGTFEHFTSLGGEFEVKSGEETVVIKAGETARYPADVQHSIASVGQEPVHGLLVVLYK